MAEIEIVLANPGERDELLAEVYYQGKFVVQVVPDGRGEFLVELPEKTDDWDLISRVVPHTALLEGLEKAIRRIAEVDP